MTCIGAPLRPRSAAIIPLGPESLRDSSSLPEGCSASLFQARRIRAGPALPSYLALLHAGFSVPRVLPRERWALTPPFHPCQMRSTGRGESPVFPKTCRRGASSPAVYFLWHFPWPRCEARLRSLRIATPWRYQARCPAVADSRYIASSPRLESGLSSRRSRSREINRRSPVSPAKIIISDSDELCGLSFGQDSPRSFVFCELEEFVLPHSSMSPRAETAALCFPNIARFRATHG